MFARQIIMISNYTTKTDGRSEGKFSGDWFLDKVLWPSVVSSWKDSHCKIEIIFDNVEYKPGFIDQVFTKLITKYKFTEFKDCFILTAADQNIIADVMAAVIGAEIKTFGHILR